MPTELVQPKTYLRTFLSLLMLLLLTVGASFLNLGPFGVMVALAIAIAKAALIILFFMEVRYSPPLVWLFAMAGFVWLIILLVISMSDYTTRSWSEPDWRNGAYGDNHVEFGTPAPKGQQSHR